jgi:hypothetical protein
MKNMLTRWTLAAMTAAALGFGASQAVASPREAETERACNPTGCNQWCRAQGGISGRCTDSGQCLCLF